MEVCQRPGPGEYATHYAKYVDLVPEGELLAHLAIQARHLEALLGGLDETRAAFRYAPGKWSVKELVNHVIDCERIFAYRLLRIARGDQTPLAGFEQDGYVAAGRADARTLEDLAAEFASVRGATLTLLASLSAEDLARTGTASGHPVSALALAHIIAGHVTHHGRILEERYIL